MRVDSYRSTVRPEPEVTAAILRALSVDPAHLVANSLILTPWNSHHTALVRFEQVFIVAGTPAEVQAYVVAGEPLKLVDW
jgi:hypothetical protein